MDYNATIAVRLKEKREEKKILAKTVAERLDLSLGAYSRIENGQTKLTVENLYNICEIIQIPLQDILQSGDKMVYNNNNNTVMQQGTNHTLNISLSPQEFDKLITVLKTR